MEKTPPRLRGLSGTTHPLPCVGASIRSRVWLSTWLSSTPNLAGMDGNRTHPGRLSSAPQTVLKTAGLASTAVHQRPPEFGYYLADSKVVRPLPQLYSKSAVILAVSLAVNRSLRAAENYPIRVRWVAAACRHIAPACVHETTQAHGDGQRLSKEPCRRMSTSNHSSGTPSLIEADQIPS